MEKSQFALEEEGIVLHVHADDSSTIVLVRDLCPVCEKDHLIQNGRCKMCRNCGWESCDL